MKKFLALLLTLFAALASAQSTVVGGGGGVSSGSAVSGCTAYSLVYIDSAGNLACGGAPAATIASTGAFSTGSGLSGTAVGLTVSNGNSTGNIAVFNDNASAVVTIADGGVTTFTQGITLGSTASFLLGSSAVGGGFLGGTIQTPDSAQYGTGSSSNALHISEYADIAFDWNNGACAGVACADPALVIHSRNQDVDEYIQLSNNGTKGTVRTGNSGQAGADFEINTGTLQRDYVVAATRAVNDNTATTLFTITMGDDTDSGGTVFFCSMATSATTDRQKTCGQINFSAIDVTAGAGGEACSSAITGTNSTAVSVGTLAVTSASTTGTDLCNVQITSDSSLNVAHTIRYRVVMHPSASAVVITPQ